MNYILWPGNVVDYPSAWHGLWADIFRRLNITDTFVWASIIHKTQALIAILSITFFSYVSLKLVLKNHNRGTILNLSVIALVCWLIGNGTFSVSIQQTWLNWFSLTAQGLTLSLYWLSAAIILIMSFYKLPRLNFLLLLAALVIFSLGILIFHPIEIAYTLIFAVVVFIFNLKKMAEDSKPKAYLAGGGLIIFAISIAAYSFIHFGKAGLTIRTVMVGGGTVPDRTLSVVSELTAVSLVIAVVFVFAAWTRLIPRVKISNGKNLPDIDPSTLFIFSSLCFIFFLVPLIPPLVRLLGFFSSQGVIWRFQFAMPWFLFLPLICHWVLQKRASHLGIETIKTLTLATIIIGILLLISFSKNGDLYVNIKSLKNLAFGDLGVQYSADQIETLRRQMIPEEKKVIYRIMDRGDLGYLLSALDGVYVLQDRYCTLDDTFLKTNKYFNGEGNLEVHGAIYKLKDLNANIKIDPMIAHGFKGCIRE